MFAWAVEWFLVSCLLFLSHVVLIHTLMFLCGGALQQLLVSIIYSTTHFSLDVLTLLSPTLFWKHTALHKAAIFVTEYTTSSKPILNILGLFLISYQFKQGRSTEILGHNEKVFATLQVLSLKIAKEGRKDVCMSCICNWDSTRQT